MHKVSWFGKGKASIRFPTAMLQAKTGLLMGKKYSWDACQLNTGRHSALLSAGQRLQGNHWIDNMFSLLQRGVCDSNVFYHHCTCYCTSYHRCESQHFRPQLSTSSLLRSVTLVFCFFFCFQLYFKTFHTWQCSPLKPSSHCKVSALCWWSSYLLFQLVTTVSVTHWRRIQRHDYCNKQALSSSAYSLTHSTEKCRQYRDTLQNCTTSTCKVSITVNDSPWGCFKALYWLFK